MLPVATDLLLPHLIKNILQLSNVMDYVPSGESAIKFP